VVNPAEPTRTAAPAPPAISPRRRWGFRLIALTAVPLCLLACAEAVLRIAGFGYEPDFFIPREINGEKFLVQNEDFSRRFFPPQTIRQPNALRMRAVKPPGSIRIFVLGESAAMGDPEPAYGPARFLEVLLADRFPGQDFEVVNVAFTAINSHVLLPLARECARHEGDVWILYMGNNEMVGPFGAATVLGAQSPPRAVVRLMTGLQRTCLGQLGAALVQKIKQPDGPAGSWGGMAMFQKQRVAPDSPKREAVYRNFAANLAGMMRAGTRSGARLIVNSVAVNLRDSPPFASGTNPTLAAPDRARFDALFEQGRQAQAGSNWMAAADHFAQALALDGSFAEAHYRRAQCLEQSGEVAAARAAYQRACDCDALPFRADARINAALRAAVAPEAADVKFLDAAATLAAVSPVGVCGAETFYEHVHFNFDGSYRLGLAWAQAVEKIHPELAARSATSDWLAAPLAEQRLGLTDWGRRLVTRSVLQRLTVPPLNTQFNNAERMQRLSRYERFLLSGLTAEKAAATRKLLETARAARPGDHFVIEAYAAFLEAVGERDGARAQWQRVAELLPHDFLPPFQLGSILAKQDKFAESEAALNRALQLRPGLVEGWNELGQCLGAQRKWAPALHAFDQAIRLRPEEPLFWAFRGKILAELGRRPDAIESYRKAITLNPGFAEAQASLGDLYSLAENLPAAVTAYQAAIRARPDYAMAHFNLGVMFARLERWDEAITEFQTTLRLEPGNALAQDYLHQVQRRRERPR
jgi:tetratricopeptide (TPR) repeat protein